MQRKISLLIVLGALLLRVFAAEGELWLDEIITLKHASGLNSLFDLFLVRHDNNHPLVTGYLYLIGGGAPPVLYRTLSIISGTILIFLIPKLLECRSTLQHLLALLLSSASFLLILYSSEARGYAPLLLCVALSVLALKNSYNPLFFWVISVLGLLSHPLYLGFFSILLIWGAYIWREKPASQLIPRCSIYFLLPIGVSTFYLFSFVLKAPVGTGPQLPLIGVILNALSLSIAGPELSDSYLQGAPYVLFTALFVLLIALIEIKKLKLEANPLWLLSLLTIFLLPAISIIGFKPRVVYERYFLISLFFVVLLLFGFCLRLLSQGIRYKLIGTAFIVTYLILNLRLSSNLITHGRTHYQQAFKTIQQESGALPMTFSSDTDRRSEIILEFYEDFSDIKYVPESEIRSSTPTWYLAHSADRYFNPLDMITLPNGTGYVLASQYRHTAISGWSLFLYRIKDQG